MSQAPTRVLITGGAGFIGSHLADRLLQSGHEVVALDNLCGQVHGDGGERPTYLDERVELHRGDIRDRDAVKRAIEGVDVIFHLAAAVGVGQSMFEIEHYTSVNSVGTAVLLEAIAERRSRLSRLVVASSMSVYGEGLYRTEAGRLIEDAQRDERDARAGRWELTRDGRRLEPLPTPESKPPSLSSIYALTKFEQERQCLLFGRANDVPTVALRFFNAYGPRQALSNPYTGVIAIFASRLLNGRAPLIFEDGMQRRDFVSVYDVAAACELAAACDSASGQVLNIGSGRSTTIHEIAELLAEVLGAGEAAPEISNEYRAGDIRHCFADITRAEQVLGFRPEWDLRRGLEDLARWLRDQHAEDRVDGMRAELRRRGVTRRTSSAGPSEVAGRNGSARDHAAASNGAKSRPTPEYLITGGCGFIGSQVAGRLAAHVRVRLLDNFSRDGAIENARRLRDEFGSRVEIVRGDVRDRDTLDECVRGVGRVLHLAAQVAVTSSLDDPTSDFETNARGTLNLLEAVRRHSPRAHVIFASTNKVYGDLSHLELIPSRDRYVPADPAVAARGIAEGNLSFCSPYGCSKGAADQYVLDYARSYGLRTTVCRMSCIYGEGQRGTEDQGWVAHFVRCAVSGRPLTIFGDGRQVRDLLHVDDLFEAYERIWRHSSRTVGRAFNVGGGPERAISLLELVEMLRLLAGRTVEVGTKPWRVADQRYFVADTGALADATGWRPAVTVDNGIRLLLRWAKCENGGVVGGAGTQREHVS